MKNRRRTVARRRGLLQTLRARLGAPHNRRLSGSRLRASGSRKDAPAEACSPKPEAHHDWRALARGAGRLALGAAKLFGVLAVLGGVGLGSYHGYRRAMACSTFNVKQIDVDGARRAPRAELLKAVQSLLGRSIFTIDVGAVARAVGAHPWVKRARAGRQLPGRILVEVEEYRPEALLHLGHLYLVDADGNVFKRATSEETEGLPVISGIDRSEYLNNPQLSRARLRRALEVLAHYHEQPRPALSEINIGSRDEITLYLRQGGLAVRLGTDIRTDRLQRFDAVWAALGPEVRRARAVFLDNEIRTDRVIVRMGSSE